MKYTLDDIVEMLLDEVSEHIRIRSSDINAEIEWIDIEQLNYELKQILKQLSVPKAINDNHNQF